MYKGSFLVLFGAAITYRFITWDLIDTGRAYIATLTGSVDSPIPLRCAAAVDIVKHLQHDLFDNGACSYLVGFI